MTLLFLILAKTTDHLWWHSHYKNGDTPSKGSVWCTLTHQNGREYKWLPWQQLLYRVMPKTVSGLILIRLL